MSRSVKYFCEQTKEGLELSADIVLFAGKPSNAARKEMWRIFLSSICEKNKEFNMNFIFLVEVPSTDSKTVMCVIEKLLCEKDIDIEKTWFCCLDGGNSMSSGHNGVQRSIWNHACHAIYINCGCHRLAFVLNI